MLANRGTSVDGGWKPVSFDLCVFSGSFGVRSIVLCKCSGKVLIGYLCLNRFVSHRNDNSFIDSLFNNLLVSIYIRWPFPQFWG